MSKGAAVPYSNPFGIERKGLYDDQLSTIYNALSFEKETSNPAFPYGEPPMIQFQCLKALFEEIGDGFE